MPKYIDLCSSTKLKICPSSAAKFKSCQSNSGWQSARRKPFASTPSTALVGWEYGQVVDPYGVDPDLPECDCIGRMYFARNP